MSEKSLYEQEIDKLRKRFNMPVEEEWEEIGFKCYEWQLNTPLVGVLVAKDESSGYSIVYSVESSPGNVTEFYGTAVLDTKLKKVPIGSVVRITFLGEEKSEKGRTYKNFKVEVKK